MNEELITSNEKLEEEKNEIEFKEETTSCGILFYKKCDNNIFVLMGINKVKYFDQMKLTTLGGRKETIDLTDEDTAVREFNEETGGIFMDDFSENKVDLKSILEESQFFYLNKIKRYRLYIVDSEKYKLDEILVDTEEKFRNSMKNADILPMCMKEMENIVWVPYTNLFNKIKVSRFVSHTISRNCEIISFFNNLYLSMIVDQARKKGKNIIKIYKNMEEPAKQYLISNNINEIKIQIKI